MPVRWVHFRVEEDLHEKMRAAAAADRRSLSNWLALTLERVLEEEPRQAEQPTPLPNRYHEGARTGLPGNAPSQYVEAMSRGPKHPLDHEPEAVTWARERSGLTKTDVARELGVAVSLISQIESGTRNATPAMLIKLARVFNCPRVVLERKRDIGGIKDDEPELAEAS